MIAVPSDVKPKYFAGATYKKKKYERKGKASQTPGSKKQENCQTNAFKSYMAKKSRSYKHKEYGNWCAWADHANRSKM